MSSRTTLIVSLICASLVCAIVAVVSGCSTLARTYKVKVNALHDPEMIAGQSYRIVAKPGSTRESDPEYQRARAAVKIVLGGRGMDEAPNPDDAQVVIEVDCGVSPGRTEFKRVPDLDLPLTSMESSDGTSIRVHRVYRKFLTVVARESASSTSASDKSATHGSADDSSKKSRATGREIWHVDVELEDEGKSFADILPVLAGAAGDAIGTDTDTQETRHVSEDDKSVQLVKRGG